MRTLRIISVSTLLAGTALVVPVAPVGAAPHAVAPKVDRVAFAPGRAVAAAATAGSGDAAGTTSVTESVLTRDTAGADVVGVSFPDQASARGVTVQVRSRQDGSWGRWTEVGLADSAPDSGTAEGNRAKVATEPVGVTGSDEVQVRVRAGREAAPLERLSATFVDGGSSAADPTVGRAPAGSASAAALQPTIISRAEWGADESLRNCAPRYVTSIKGAIVHHTVNSNTYSSADVPALLRGIYAYHVNGNGWCDVGYNFFADRFGRLFEGRFGGISKNVEGAQAQGFNAQSFGVSSLGNHDPSTAGAATPPSAELAAIGRLIGWKGSLNGWDPGTSVSYTSAGSNRYAAGTVVTKPRVSGHRDVNLTECPGDLMYSRLSTIRATATSSYEAGVVDTRTAATATPVVETYARPAGTSISLSGRGFGHGRGMSQYGAYGAALKGLTEARIMSFYYPGTTRSTSAGNPSLRVHLTEVGTGGTQVAYVAGLSATDGTRTVSLNRKTATGAQVSRWRVVPAGSGLSLQWYDAGWKTLPGWSALGVPVTFLNASTQSVRVALFGGSLRDYRGTASTHRVGTVAATVNVTPLQAYLQGVVPAEMPPSWSAEALKAQAVAARTYALRHRATASAGSLYDTCDSTTCQVYKGAAEWTASGARVQREWPSTTSAVNATSGVALTYGGSYALTEFGSSNGGRTVASSLPYQRSYDDPYDGIPSGSSATWTKVVSLSTIERAYPAVGSYRGLRVDARDGISVWDGRTTKVTVLGAAGSTTVTGDQFRAALGLRSPWWTVASAPATSRETFPKDVSSDSLADLLAVDPAGHLQVLRGNGVGAFSATSAGVGWSGFDLITSAGAWTADNRHDVLARRGDVLYVYPGASGGRLLGRAVVSSGWSTRNLLLGAGDLDRDGHPDLVSRTTDGRLWLHRGDGAGATFAPKSLGTGWQTMRTVVAPGDVTGDGIPDVLAVRASDSTLFLYAGTSAGVIAPRVEVDGSWSGYAALIGPGDVTGDGRGDLVGRRSSDGALVVLSGDGTGAFAVRNVVSGTATWAAWTRWAP